MVEGWFPSQGLHGRFIHFCINAPSKAHLRHNTGSWIQHFRVLKTVLTHILSLSSIFAENFLDPDKNLDTEVEVDNKSH